MPTATKKVAVKKPAAKKPAVKKESNGASETREEKRAAKEAALKVERQERIASGDLVVDKGRDFDVSTPTTARYVGVGKVIEVLSKSKGPVLWEELAEKAEVKYPEDLSPALHALTHIGYATRLTTLPGEASKSRRRVVAYSWSGPR